MAAAATTQPGLPRTLAATMQAQRLVANTSIAAQIAVVSRLGARLQRSRKWLWPKNFQCRPPKDVVIAQQTCALLEPYQSIQSLLRKWGRYQMSTGPAPSALRS